MLIVVVNINICFKCLVEIRGVESYFRFLWVLINFEVFVLILKEGSLFWEREVLFGCFIWFDSYCVILKIWF